VNEALVSEQEDLDYDEWWSWRGWSNKTLKEIFSYMTSLSLEWSFHTNPVRDQKTPIRDLTAMG
jgi:hypothetical protein